MQVTLSHWPKPTIFHLKKNSLGFRKHTELISAFIYIYIKIIPPNSQGHCLTRKSILNTRKCFQIHSTRGLPIHWHYLHSVSKPGELPLASPCSTFPYFIEALHFHLINCYLTVPQPFPIIASILLHITGFTYASQSMNAFEASIEQMQHSYNLSAQLKSLLNCIFLNIFISFVT